MPTRYADAARKAAELTNKQLTGELAMLSPLNDKKLRQLLPTKKDKETFAKLMAIVESDTAADEQLTYFGDNLQTAGKVVLKLLKYFL